MTFYIISSAVHQERSQASTVDGKDKVNGCKGR